MPESETGAPKIAERGAPGRIHLAALRIDGPALRAPLDLPSPALTLRQRRGPLSHATHVLAQASLCQATLSRDTLCPKRTPALSVRHAARRSPASHACRPLLPGRGRAYRSRQARGPRADHPRPFRPCPRRPRRGARDTPRRSTSWRVRYGEDFAGTTQAAELGEPHRHRRRHRRRSIRPATCSARPRSRSSARACASSSSGDYKRAPDPTCAPFEPVPCDVFITEATFGLPVFRHPDAARRDRQAARLASRQFPERAHLVGAYALGKAQRVIAAAARRRLRRADLYPRRAAKAHATTTQADGIDAGRRQRSVADRRQRASFAGAIVLGPPSAVRRTAGRAASPTRSRPSPPAGCGCAQRARQRGVELPLVISDHSDWDELCRTILEIGAERGLGHARPRGGAGPLVRDAGHQRAAAAPRRLRGRGRSGAGRAGRGCRACRRRPAEPSA